MKYKTPSWRNDIGINNHVTYNKKFAILPVICSDGIKVWLKYYYKKYERFYVGTREDALGHGYIHTDYVESITEAEYIVRKLIEGYSENH